MPNTQNLNIEISIYTPMDKKRVVGVIVTVLLIVGAIVTAVVFNRPLGPEKRKPIDPREHTQVGELEIYFRDRYGVNVQAYLYYPSTFGSLSPPQKIQGGYPAIVFGCGYKGDNSIYEWIARNISKQGYVVFVPDFVNNTSPWAETENGWISGFYCDTYGGNASLPVQYEGSNELWPDVWPWAYELIDAAKYLINASKNNNSYFNGNTTVHLGGLIDTSRMAAMGHSTGGAMAIVATMIYKYFKLAIALAPYDDVLSNVYWPPFPSDYIGYQAAAPILIVVGTRDVITPKVANADNIFNHANSPKMLVEILDGNHMYFCDSEDILNSLIEPLAELPITATPIKLEKQQNITINVSTQFLDYHFNPPAKISPYVIPDDMDGDDVDDINKSFDIGPVFKITEAHFNHDLSYTITVEIVPLGIGWGNSTVYARFYDILRQETDFSPIAMDYQYGTYADPYSGRFKCTVAQNTYYFSIEATSTDRKTYETDLERFIT
jgi:dienelactone hydrolase